MLSNRTAQTLVRRYAQRPRAERRTADPRIGARISGSGPSVNQAARKMLGHWPSKSSQGQLIRRLA
jgi:hypothetical protein